MKPGDYAIITTNGQIGVVEETQEHAVTLATPFIQGAHQSLTVRNCDTILIKKHYLSQEFILQLEETKNFILEQGDTP